MKSWLLIENGNLIDGTGAPVKPATSVLVEGNSIVAVGADANRKAVPRDARLRVVDATGKWVMPGLIDVHCHMTYGESRAQEEQDIYTSVESRTLIAAWNAKKVLRAGVTSISQPGGSWNIGVALREGIKSGIVEGPRMTTAGRYLSTYNSLTDWYPSWIGVPDSSIGVSTNTIDEMRTEVRRQVKDGVDYIKLADSPFGNFQAFSNDEMKSVTDLAHQLGVAVTIHARGSAETSAAIDAGMDWIMHSNLMSDEVIDKLAHSGTPLVPTLLLLANQAEWGHLCGVPSRARTGAARMLERTAETYHKARAADVKFVVGTDTGFATTPYGEWHARELELLIKYAGLSALEAIRAGTMDAAFAMGLAGKLGVVGKGYLADVIVISADPVANIRVLADRSCIDTVIKDGAVVHFDDEDLARHVSNDRARFQADRELTHEVVNKDPGNPAASNGDDMPWGEETRSSTDEIEWTQEEGQDLVSDLRRRERARQE